MTSEAAEAAHSMPVIPIPPVQLPEKIVALAAEYDDGARQPAEPRNAATVVLLRDGSGPEVYLMRRQTSMAFAAGMCVFPGGGVDQRDFDGTVGWAGPPAEDWAELLGTSVDVARALVCAAVRETFEESGVLFAGPTADTVVDDTTGEDWEADRIALESRELAMTDFLTRRNLVLRTDLLAPWSAWLTPIFEPRRYRTWFFVGQLPAGQRTRDVSSESSSVEWVSAIGAVEQVEAGEMAMMPPTYLTCLDVAQHDSAGAACSAAAGRAVRMFMPEVEPLGDGFTLSMPDDLRDLRAARRSRDESE